MAIEMTAEQKKVTKEFEEQYSKVDRRTQEAVDYNIMNTLDKLHGKNASEAQIKLGLYKIMADQTLAMKENVVVRASNDLTPSVDLYSLGKDKSMTSFAASVTPATDNSASFKLTQHYGLDAEALHLTRLSVVGNVTTNQSGDLSGSGELRAVKAFPEALQPEGAILFAAGGVGVNVDVDAKSVTPTATLLGVAASDIGGMPVGGYAGGVANLSTGRITKVVHGEGTINADTPYAATFGLGADTGKFTAATTGVNVSIFQKYYDASLAFKTRVPVDEPKNTAFMLEANIQY